jgi:hypothetical protein
VLPRLPAYESSTGHNRKGLFGYSYRRHRRPVPQFSYGFCLLELFHGPASKSSSR